MSTRTRAQRDKAVKLFDALPTNPAVQDLARRVHPTWVAARGHANDLGVAVLAQEIGQCIAAIEATIEAGEWHLNSHATGFGIYVSKVGENYNVAVIAGETNEVRIQIAGLDN